MIVGERAPRHERGDDVDVAQLGELVEDLGRPRLQDPAARVDDGPAGREDHLGRLPHLLGWPRVVAGSRAGSRRPRRRLASTTPWPSAGSSGRRCPSGCRAAPGPGRPVVAMWNAWRTAIGMSARFGDQIVVLGHRPGDADRVALLEGVGADGGRRHLAGDHHDRHRVHVRVAQGRDDVGRGGTRCHHRDARTACGVGIALRHVPGALLVAHEDVADRRVDDRVVHRQDGPARKAEHDLDPFHLQRSYERLTSVELHVPRAPIDAVPKTKATSRWEVGGAHVAVDGVRYMTTTIAGRLDIAGHAATRRSLPANASRTSVHLPPSGRAHTLQNGCELLGFGPSRGVGQNPCVRASRTGKLRPEDGGSRGNNSTWRKPPG